LGDYDCPNTDRHSTLGDPRPPLFICSSESRRRSSRRSSEVGGSLRDIQASLGTTARYIEADAEAQRKVVALI
jgi:hypothetical protein